MNHHSSPLTRRSALSLLPLALAGGLSLAYTRSGKANQTLETRAVGFTWLIYTDAAGDELARMRPYAMQDISDLPNVETPAGERSLSMSVTIWNTGVAPLTVPPSAFALWGVDGRLHRPRNVYIDAAPEQWLQERHDHMHSASAIPSGSKRFGWIHFRAPAEAPLAGLLFIPEPERILVVADFSIPSTVIVD